MGERIPEWLMQLVDRVLTQSSDNEYHCLTITLFLARDPGAHLAEVPPTFSRSVVPRQGR